jgi:hypothetical protein
MVKLPDVTPAQVLAVITFILTQAVAYGLIDGTVQQAALSAAGTIVPAVWAFADAFLRGKRNEVRAVALAAGKPDPAAK